MKCSDDSAILKKFIERDRIYDFLAGLNAEFDQVRIQILGREELPPLNEAISMVRAEESRGSLMLEPSTSEGSAMVSNSSKSRSLNPEQQPDLSKTSNRDTLWCTYCKKPRHTKER
ncbi:hypothetical protein EZV62_027704 [Acer yangbiense]|uniref:Uncharacterized protein n=1 Tax=Acer yangbiense TaxID=1000413 RepID=A0A5C7GUW3_9ROSI|nr:hypothetical protein EZV62_027704 [Acer yangbiense]